MNDGADEEAGKRKGKRLPTKASKGRATSDPASTCSSVQDAAVALADGDAQSLARFFRGLLPSSAKNGGPQHVCLKHAFVLLDRRWSVDKTFPTATADGADPPPLMFGRKESLLSPELFANIVSFLNPNHALRTTSTCKAWWRNVSSLPLAAHLNLCTLRLRPTPPMTLGASMGWQDLLHQLRHITSRNPYRVVTRLTLNGSVKLGSISNLSSAAGGLLTHIDFSRARSSRLNFHQLGVGMPGLKGLRVEETLYCTDSREWVKSLARLTSVVSLESLRVYAAQVVSDAEGETFKYRCCLDDSFLVSIASSGESLRKLWLVGAHRYGVDVEDGMATLGAAVPRLEVLTTDMLVITDKGWAAFAAARLASKRYLVSIRIRAPGASHVPSEPTRALLMDAVTESLLLSDSSWNGHSSLPSPSTTVVVDCEGRVVVAGRDGGSELSSEKLRVTFGGPWKSNYDSNADDV